MPEPGTSAIFQEKSIPQSTRLVGWSALVQALAIAAPVHRPSTVSGQYVSGSRREEGEWTVFDKRLMRGMVRELGADPAATDASRVLRMPGYFNHKRDAAFLIRTSELSDGVSHPADFPEFRSESRSEGHARPDVPPRSAEFDR